MRTTKLESGAYYLEQGTHPDVKSMKRFRSVFCVLVLLVLAVQMVYYMTMEGGSQMVVGDIKTAINRDRLGRTHPILTYFKRRNDDGSYKDASDASNAARIPDGLFLDRTANTTVELRVSPEIVSNGDTVGVAWRGVPHPTQDDWIGLYCPRDAKVSHYLDFYTVKEIPTHYHSNGKFSVQVYNLRSTCEFRYYSVIKEDLILVAKSNELKFAGGLEDALYGHLALTGHNGEMRVMWVSGHDTMPTVRFGYSNDVLKFKVTGTSWTYTSNHMCGPPAAALENFVSPGFLHDVLLAKLKPSTRYYYQFGAGSGWSKIHSFETPPLIGTRDTFKFITYGDMGLYPPAAPTVASLVRKEAEHGAKFVLHQGDLSYAGGYAYLWDQWLSMIEPISTRVPYMIAIGNHEQSHLIGGGKDPSKAEGNGFHPPWGNYLDDSGGECGVPPHYRFHMPDSGNSVWWYSFDYGTVHFVMMSTEHNFTAGSRQYQWLESDLASVDKSVTPWIILAGHRPMYCSIDFPSDYQVSLYMQKALEELFHKFRVDLGLYGHYHSYERSCRVYKHKCTNDGMVHIVVGTAGASMDGYPSRSVGWSEYCNTRTIGYGRVTVVGDKELRWEYVSADDGSVMDKTVIKR